MSGLAQNILSNFVSYKNLSPSLCAFVSQIANVAIPNNVHEALKITKWKELFLRNEGFGKECYVGVGTFTQRENRSWLKMDVHCKVEFIWIIRKVQGVVSS